MPLIVCTDCKKEFSESLTSCPKCSKPVENIKNNSKLALIFPISLIFVAIFFGSVLYGVYTDNFSSLFPVGIDDKDQRASWGALGDFFGGLLNPILTFLSLVLLAVTLRLNQIELSLSRQELVETRKEVANSSKALSEQAESLELQNFESTFFRMLELYNNRVDSLKSSSSKAEGDYFTGLANHIERAVRSDENLMRFHSTIDESLLEMYNEINTLTERLRKERMGGMFTGETDQTDTKAIGEKIGKLQENLSFNRRVLRDVNDKKIIADLFNCHFPKEKIQSLNNYFSTIESLLGYVYKSDKAVVAKSFYYDLIVSQMSADEVYFLFYALLSNQKFERLKLLCTDAALFKKMETGDFIYGENHQRHYEKRAFGKHQ